MFQTSSPTEEVSSSSEDTSQSQTAAQMNFPASSSMMVNIPKPKRLNDAEKIQLESNSDWIDKDQPQADNDLSVRGVEEMDLESKDTCVQEDETQEVELSKDIMEDKCTDGEHNNLTVSLPHSDSMERQQEDTNNHPPKPREAEEHVDFISQNLIETVSAAISEIHIKPDEESNVSPTAATEVLDENKPAFTFKAPSSEFYEHEQKNRSPRQSILCKARPSLVPIDQNAIVRKVRFADVNTSSISPVECESKCTEVLTESPKKKLVRVPQPRKYKTRIIVSKELD